MKFFRVAHFRITCTSSSERTTSILGTSWRFPNSHTSSSSHLLILSPSHLFIFSSPFPSNIEHQTPNFVIKVTSANTIAITIPQVQTSQLPYIQARCCLFLSSISAVLTAQIQLNEPHPTTPQFQRFQPPFYIRSCRCSTLVVPLSDFMCMRHAIIPWKVCHSDPGGWHRQWNKHSDWGAEWR